MSPKRALSSLVSPPLPPPPPPQDQLARPQNTVFFHLKSKASRAEPIHLDG